MENVSEDYKKWMFKLMDGKLKDLGEEFGKILERCELVEKEGYKIDQLYKYGHEFHYMKHVNSDNNGYWEGFYLKVNLTRFYLTYKKKLPTSSTELILTYDGVSKIEEISDLENKSLEIGLLLK